MRSLQPHGASLPLAGDVREDTGTRPGWMRGSRWMRLRRVVIASQRGVCADCQQAPVAEVHHLVPVSACPGSWAELDNLLGLCRECHAIRHRAGGAGA